MATPANEQSEQSPVTSTSPGITVAPSNTGSKKAWSSVVAGFFFQFASFGFLNALGSFQYEYEKNILTHSSTSSISWISTVQLFIMFFLSQPVGLLTDLFGPRYITIPASVFSVGGLIGLSYSTQYYQIFLAQSICYGIGAAGTFMPGLVIAGQHFKQRRALAIGIVASGSSLGGVIFPIFFAQLFTRIGFGGTMRYAALLIGVLLVLANCLIFSANKPSGWEGRRALTSLAVFKSPEFVLYLIGGFFYFWGLFGPFNYLPLFASMSQETKSIALYTVSIINASSVFGRIIPSYFSDKLGHLATMTTVSYFSALATLVIWLPVNFQHSLAGILIFALVFGFSSGGFVSLMTPSLVQVCGGHTDDLGAKLGTFMMVVAFASLTGLPIQGAIADREDGSLNGLIIFCGACMLIGSGLIHLVCVRVRALGKATRESANTIQLQQGSAQ